jgi:dTDP-4-dehydrorhamnose 3,5-epimerase-like enzyme
VQRTVAWKLVDLPTHRDLVGALTVLERTAAVSFPIERVYFVHGVPAGSRRGGHSHHHLEQLLIASSGGFDVLVDDGETSERIRLDRPDVGLYIGRDVWRELEAFTEGAVCLVLASAPYDPDDYCRDHRQFLTEARKRL